MSSGVAALSAPPRVRVAPRYSSSDGPDAVFLASAYGLKADPWQADVLDDWLARRKDGSYASVTAGLVLGRQNGKNACIEIRELFGLVELGEKFVHTAHEVKTARKAFKRLKWFFGERAQDPNARFPELNALVETVRNTNGQEGIYLSNGGYVEVAARSKGGSRGFTVDVIVLDEAQILDEAALEALLSTISSAEIKPQMIVTGTPPNPDKGESGEVFRRIRAMQGQSKSLSWIEYGAEDGPLPDIEDENLLRVTNPALGTRLHREVIDLERALLTPEGFARERLGWWGNPDVDPGGVINLTDWSPLKDSDAKQPERAVAVVDVSPNRTTASIGVAGDGSAGRTLVLVETNPGTAWVVPALVKLRETGDIVEVALHPQSQAGALIPDIVAAGIDFHPLTSAEMGQGCAAFQTGIVEGTLQHVGQVELDAAVANARTRYSGEAELWDRRNRSIDISPLVAVSAAAYRWAKFADYDVTDSIF